MSNSDLDRAAHHIMRVWHQYSRSVEKPDGSIYLEHMCMSAGEGAAEWLEHYGYAVEDGWGVTLTAKGMEVMKRDDYEGF